MSDAGLVVILLGAGTYVLKALGPLYFGNNRELPTKFKTMALLLPTPLIAALVITSTFSSDNTLTFDARIIGVIAAGLALWRKLPFVFVVVFAAFATAIFRLLVA
ncbi:MAG: AzlD domain-containing protein [Actinomycetota bacterium]|nr:AzlD domain-containing protein [Actinomycetota bacterium]MEC7292965.1 AzlD domain-containing protein [Actinomycetota bacterium]MEC7366438.1 AzlD domain-containing protein [Actinomycetota bacterium]MEE3016657.1 AzlD domain-containing protein [Actinomycetota bacterium]